MIQKTKNPVIYLTLNSKQNFEFLPYSWLINIVCLFYKIYLVTQMWRYYSFYLLLSIIALLRFLMIFFWKGTGPSSWRGPVMELDNNLQFVASQTDFLDTTEPMKKCHTKRFQSSFINHSILIFN